MTTGAKVAEIFAVITDSSVLCYLDRERAELELGERPGSRIAHLREVDPARDSAVAALVEAARAVVKRSTNRSVVGSLEWDLHNALINLTSPVPDPPGEVAFPPSSPPSNSSPAMAPPVTAEHAAEGTTFSLKNGRSLPDGFSIKYVMIGGRLTSVHGFGGQRSPLELRATGCYDEIPPTAPSPSPATTGGESAEASIQEIADGSVRQAGTSVQFLFGPCDSQLVDCGNDSRAFQLNNYIRAIVANRIQKDRVTRDATLSAAHAEKVRELEKRAEYAEKYGEAKEADCVQNAITIAALTKERDEFRAYGDRRLAENLKLMNERDELEECRKLQHDEIARCHAELTRLERVNDYSRCVGPSERGAGSAVNAQDASQPATGSTQVDGQAAGISRERALQARQGEGNGQRDLLIRETALRLIACQVQYEGMEGMDVENRVGCAMEVATALADKLAALASSGAKG
jgi:hypothetical protein